MLDYRGLSVSQASMLNWTAETAGRRALPGFSANAVQDGALAHALRKLHGLVMDGAGGFEKEEALLLLLSGLLRKYGQTAAPGVPDLRGICRKNGGGPGEGAGLFGHCPVRPAKAGGPPHRQHTAAAVAQQTPFPARLCSGRETAFLCVLLCKDYCLQYAGYCSRMAAASIL